MCTKENKGGIVKYLIILFSIFIYMQAYAGFWDKTQPKLKSKIEYANICKKLKRLESIIVDKEHGACIACDHIMANYGGGQSCFVINCDIIDKCLKEENEGKDIHKTTQ